jgi:hypothetical protein
VQAKAANLPILDRSPNVRRGRVSKVERPSPISNLTGNAIGLNLKGDGCRRVRAPAVGRNIRQNFLDDKCDVVDRAGIDTRAPKELRHVVRQPAKGLWAGGDLDGEAGHGLLLR